jgi:ribosomal protein L29
MKTKELRQKSAIELEKTLQDIREKLGSLNYDLAGGKVKNIKEIREISKDIAKILTLQAESRAAEKKVK